MEYDTTQEIECMFCHSRITIRYNRDDMSKWLSGALIQNAFPYLDSGDRELLKTKMCGKCFDDSFPPEHGG